MPLLPLFRKLLLLCRQQASCTLRYLHKIIALLARYIKSWRHLPRRGPSGRCDDNLEAKGSDACMGTDTTHHSRPLNIKPASVLACSTDITGTPFPTPESAPPGDNCTANPGQFGTTEVIEGTSQFQTATQGTTFAEGIEVLDGEMECTAPSTRPRYNRNIKIKSTSSEWEFSQLGTYDLYRSLDIRSRVFDGPWRYYVHPEGLPYYHLEHIPLGLSFLTEADIQDESVLSKVERFMTKIQERVANFEWKSINRPRRIEVVLEEIQGGWHYYMVDVERQIVFWLDDFTITLFLGESYGIEKADHCRAQLEFEYWSHIEHFPNHREFERETYREAIGALNHWRVELTTSSGSTAPYDSGDLLALIESLRTLEGTVESGKNNAYAVTSLARIMALIWIDRFVHFYGSPGARLDIDQSVREGPDMSHSWFIKFSASLLFFAPYSYLSGIRRLWIDGLVQERAWKAYRPKLEQGWSSFVLMSTVLLNANVALLTTPIVLSDNRDDNNLVASPAAVASQISIIASMGSIIIGLFLISHVRTIQTLRGSIGAGDFVTFVGIGDHARFGLEIVAILYSLPYALLVWGMATFSASIAISCFLKIDGWPTTAIQAIYALAWMLVVPLILWTVITNWEMSNKKHWSYPMADLQRKGRDMMKTWSRRKSQNETSDITDVNSHDETGSTAV